MKNIESTNKSSHNALANIEKAGLLIASAKTLDETFVLKALFKEAEIRARKKGLVDVEQKAVEYRFWVNDKIGELLENMKETGELSSGNPSKFNVARKGRIKSLKELGISEHESSRLQKYHKLSQKDKDAIIESAKKRIERVKSKTIDETLDENVPITPVKIPDSVSIKILHSDFKEVKVEPNSIDLILTDPPYGKQYISLWPDLGKYASKILKPGGWLVSLSGQANRLEKLQGLSSNLKYYWEYALVMKGPFVNYGGLEIRWKPIDVFFKEPKSKKVNGADLINGQGEDKRFHDWGQNVGEFAELLEQFSKPNDLVFEPFAGGGATIEACLRTKRNCIASEIQGKSFKVLKERFPQADFQ
jgi:16S rRNA G966 N2-methylase RsmD